MNNFVKLIAPYFTSENKHYARWGLVLVVILSQCGTAFGYFFIQWNRRFYDAIENRNADVFMYEACVFCLLAVSYLIIYSYTKYYSQQYALKWRLWMTGMALDKWISKDNRDAIEGSDQRIQEDLMRFTMLFERFFLDCFNALVLVMFFIPLMFSLTSNLYIGAIPLSWILFLAAVSYTGIGMYISARVAHPLIQLEYDNQKIEAEFRYRLVHARDGADVPRTVFNSILDVITDNYERIYKRQRLYNVWQKSYDQFSFLIPFILMGSSYFAGVVSFGMLMQIKATFSRIRNSMSYLLDHYTELTEMISIARRLVEFYAHIDPSRFNSTNQQNLVTRADPKPATANLK